MDKERFKKILGYSKENREKIEQDISLFCASMNIKTESDIRNLLLLVRDVFPKRGFMVFETPFYDDEIGALCFKGDGLGYVVINSSIPKVNSNFAVAHELYHVFVQKGEFRSKVELLDENYYDNEEELSANVFSGALLMPETSFRRMFDKFDSESDAVIDVICKLMSYFETPYMATLIRCCELDLISMEELTVSLMQVGKNDIFEAFTKLWLDPGVLEATNRDDYANVEKLVEMIGEDYLREGIINQRTVDLVKKNMNVIINKIRGNK